MQKLNQLLHLTHSGVLPACHPFLHCLHREQEQLCSAQTLVITEQQSVPSILYATNYAERQNMQPL